MCNIFHPVFCNQTGMITGSTSNYLHGVYCIEDIIRCMTKHIFNEQAFIQPPFQGISDGCWLFKYFFQHVMAKTCLISNI